MNDRLAQDHVGGERLVPRDELASLARVHARKHLHPAIVLGLPFTGIVGGELVFLDAVEGGLQLALIELVDRHERHALGLPVLEPDRIAVFFAEPDDLKLECVFTPRP